MKLRRLKCEDAPLMLEWMHDKNVTENLQANFAAKTLEDCVQFIVSSKTDMKNEHFAIVDENDEYMGTVSLKNIDESAANAEFAISIRTCAMGRGYSKSGMAEMIRWGLEQRKLEMIYWCVSPDNKRAVRFYDKNGYKRIASVPKQAKGYTKDQVEYFIWYKVEK